MLQDRYSFDDLISQEGWKCGKFYGTKNRCEQEQGNLRESVFHLQPS